MVTTIQLNENVKIALNRMKENGKETYEEIILRMMRTLEKQRREQKELMIEGYKEMAGDMKKLSKEWSAVDLEGWPEYDEN